MAAPPTLGPIRYIPVDLEAHFTSPHWLAWENCPAKCAETLFWKSWRESPPGTMPDDDAALAEISGAGVHWLAWKAEILSFGWITAPGLPHRLVNPIVQIEVMRVLLERRQRAEGGRAGENDGGRSLVTGSGAQGQRLDARRRAALESLARVFGRRPF